MIKGLKCPECEQAMRPIYRGVSFTNDGDVTVIEIEWRCEEETHYIHISRRYRILATEEEKTE